jgi:hypothetical protein
MCEQKRSPWRKTNSTVLPPPPWPGYRTRRRADGAPGEAGLVGRYTGRQGAVWVGHRWVGGQWAPAGGARGAGGLVGCRMNGWGRQLGHQRAGRRWALTGGARGAGGRRHEELWEDRWHTVSNWTKSRGAGGHAADREKVASHDGWVCTRKLVHFRWLKWKHTEIKCIYVSWN